MVNIARKNIFADLGRFLASVSGVAFSIYLILFLRGMVNSFKELSGAYINAIDIDLTVAQEGVRDLYHSPSIIDESLAKQIIQISGGKAYNIINWMANIKVSEEDGSKIIDYLGRKSGSNKNGKDSSVILTGYNPSDNIGGPKIIISGKDIPGHREIIVDRSFLSQNNLSLGDQVEIFDNIFTISGVTINNNILTMSRAFINLDEAQEIVNEKEKVNFILIKLQNSEDALIIKDKIEKTISGISVFTKKDFADRNAKLIDEGFSPIINIISIIGFVTGVVVVGLTIYNSTMERIKEYGALKAVGASSKILFLIVFEQAFWSIVLGFFVAVFMVLFTQVLTKNSNSIITTELVFIDFVFGAVVSFLISILSTFIPVRRISKIDPVDVFRS